MSDVIFLDSETTGLEPATSVIIDVWAELRRGPSLDLIASSGCHVEVSEAEISRASPKALEVNGYTSEAWQDAVPWPVAWELIEDVICQANGAVIAIAGSNPRFDIDMMMGMHWRYNTRPISRRLLLIDTVDLAQPLKRAGLIRDCKLATLGEHFGIGAQDHTARGDVAMAVEVYRRLMA